MPEVFPLIGFLAVALMFIRARDFLIALSS